MVESIKQNGQVNLDELSAKQIIALVSLWDDAEVKNDNDSFSTMLKKCYKSDQWNENARIWYVYGDDAAVSIGHAFRDLYDFEEENIMNALKK